MNNHCRQFQKNDIEPLRELILELGYTVDLPGLERNIHEINRKDGTIFVYEKSKQILGSICVVEVARLAEGFCCEIVSLVVSEKFRGHGMGKVLVKAAEEWANNRSGTIRVRANVIRSDAHRFYEKQGFVEIKSQKVFSKKL